MDKWNSLKAQVGIEFMAMVGFALLFFIIISAVAVTQQNKISHEKEELIVEDIALSVQREVIIAAKVRDGYYREFLLPLDGDGIPYEITNTNQSIDVSTPKKVSHKKIPEIIGTFNKGQNTIRKQNGTIYVN